MQHENYRLGEGTMPYTTNDLITHYNCGDLNTVIYSHDTAQVILQPKYMPYYSNLSYNWVHISDSHKNILMPKLF